MASMNKLLRYIEIETCNLCTRRCPWCLYGQINGFADRKFEILETEFIKNILNELKENNFSGMICLYSMNEPLLDQRICNGYLIDLCREILGEKVIIKINTNGDLLTETILSRLVDKCDILQVSCYDKQVYENILPYKKKYPSFELIDFSGVKREKLKYNRAGSIENIMNFKNKNVNSCHLPYYTTVIGYDGNVRLCSFDSLPRIHIGNIKENKIFDILNSPSMKTLRRKIYNDRSNVCPCNECNYEPYAIDKRSKS